MPHYVLSKKPFFSSGITYQIKTSVLQRSPSYNNVTCHADSISIDLCSFGGLDDGGCAKIMGLHCQGKSQLYLPAPLPLAF